MIHAIITVPSLSVQMMHATHLHCQTNVSPREKRDVAARKGTLIKLSLLDKWLSFSLLDSGAG